MRTGGGCICADVGGLAVLERSCSRKQWQSDGRTQGTSSVRVSRAGERCFRYGKCAEGPGYFYTRIEIRSWEFVNTMFRLAWTGSIWESAAPSVGYFRGVQV